MAYLAYRERADDLTQETFLRALRGLKTFRGDVPARVWLLSIARRPVVDHFRKQGRSPVPGASRGPRFSRPTRALNVQLSQKRTRPFAVFDDENPCRFTGDPGQS